MFWEQNINKWQEAVCHLCSTQVNKYFADQIKSWDTLLGTSEKDFATIFWRESPTKLDLLQLFCLFCYNCTNIFPIMFPASVSDEVGSATLVENCCYEVYSENLQQSFFLSMAMSPTRSICHDRILFLVWGLRRTPAISLARSVCFVFEPFFATIELVLLHWCLYGAKVEF
jgi:hypothetical protein